MISDVYKSTNTAHTTEYILSEVERLGKFCHLDDSGARKLRLLTEELLSLTVRLFEGYLEYEIFVENHIRRFRINLNAKTIVNPEQRDKLLSLINENKNVKEKSMLDKISEAFTSLVICDASLYNSYGGVYIFPLADYREQPDNKISDEQWDGIEQSIILSLANNVRISITDNNVEVVIEMFL